MRESDRRYDWRADVRARVASARLHPQDEADLVEEVAQHLEEQFEELAPNIGAAAARARLLADLGDRELDAALAGRRRRSRAMRPSGAGTGSVLRDVRYGLRALHRSPGTVAAGAAALALGVGLTTLMFSIIYGLLIKGLPYDDGGRIATIYRADPTGRGMEDLVPLGDFVRYRAEQRSFDIFGAYAGGEATVTGGDRPERVNAARVTAGALDVTGVRPMLGRLLIPADNALDARPSVVLGYAIWRDRFAADSSVLGKVLRVDGRAYTIVGVMPNGFVFPSAEQLWLPLQLDASTAIANQGPPVTILGRLRSDVDYVHANAELRGISRRLADAYADTAAMRTSAQPYIRARMPSRVYTLLYAMLGAVFLVLLVACGNVANLLLDRAATRAREVGIRFALGASRFAVMRQSLAESSIIAALGAVGGTALAQVGIVVFNRAMTQSGEMPFWMDVRLHVPVLLFVVATVLLASLLSGLLPAIHSARLDVSAILKDESHGTSSLRVSRTSRALVVGQIALSSALLLAAGFMTKSIIRLRAFDPRLTSENVTTARITLASHDTTAQRRFFASLQHDLAGVSGLDGAYVGNGLPGTGWQGDRVAIEGRSYPRPRDVPFTRWLAVNPAFFSTFNVSVLRGRAIRESDRAGSELVALVSDAFVRREFPDGDPIGKRLRLGGASGDSLAPSERWLTIVGVFPSVYAANPVNLGANPFPAEVVTAFSQEPRVQSASVALRGPASVANAATLRKLVASIDPEVPVYAVDAMDAVLARPAGPARLFGSLFVIFGMISLTLAAIGLYAVTSFSVSRRVREVGVRMALGATGGDVMRMICRQGAVQVATGMSLGLLAGAGLVKGMSTMLFGVKPGDPSVFLVVAGVLGAAAFAACIIPAAGATRVDPVVALRNE